MKTHSPKLLGALVSRHLKMFFKNKMTFFFSLLVPCITLAIYFLFLRELEVSAVTGVIGGLNLQDPDPLINASYRLIDSWMLSGILAVSCISVSFNACYIIISDREKGVNREFLAAPVSKSLISFSYFVFNCIVTLIIVSAVLFICLGYLGASGNFRLTFANFGYIYLVIILSVISAATISTFLSGFIHSGNTYNSLIAIMSAAIGFLIGGYMPISMLPEGAQNLTAFFPGTYSAGLLRNYFMSDQIASLEAYMRSVPEYAPHVDELLDALSGSFSLDLTVFGSSLSVNWMYLMLVVGIVLFFLLNVLLSGRSLRLGVLGKKKKARKKALEKGE